MRTCFFIGVVLCLGYATTAYAQDPNQANSNSGDSSISPAVWVALGMLIMTGLGFCFKLWQWWRSPAQKEAEKEAELNAVDKRLAKKVSDKEQTDRERFENTLREELGSVRMLGSPDIPNVPVGVLDTFVSLDISTAWRTDQRFDPKGGTAMSEVERNVNPDTVMQRAFQKGRMLLLIGDPGSGKTTLMKYYAMCSLTGDFSRLGFDQRPLPLYLPLRKVSFCDEQPDKPLDLDENLKRWADGYQLGISAETFRSWLDKEPILLLLDGLDEISDIDQRRAVCEWIDGFAPGLQTARIVVTSRWTGYRKVEGIELGFDHLRADIKDFSSEQQADFLRKWTRAAYLGEVAPADADLSQWEIKQEQQAERQAEKIIAFLEEEKNRAVRDLAAVPMLLQIIAVIWKERGLLLQQRSDLFQAAVNYLLDFRDRKRKLDPLLSAGDARRVLQPAAWWMQQEVKTDEVLKTSLHGQMQAVLDTLPSQPNAEAFCKNIRDRAGLIADYGKAHYIFRHKSLREYLAGVQLSGEIARKPDLMQDVVCHLGDDWWEETLRFFMAEIDDQGFNLFMNALFHGEISKDLSVKQQTFLRTLIGDARQRPIDALSKCLNDGRFSEDKKRYVLDCLKTIGTKPALETISQYREKAGTGVSAALAEEIIAEETVTVATTAQVGVIDSRVRALKPFFRNPHEFNAEYILIPGGSYDYTVEMNTQTVSVPNLYFAKYPVTNQRYRRFIEYLAGEGKDLQQFLPCAEFSRQLFEFAQGCEIEGMADYLGDDAGQLPKKFRSAYDTEKRYESKDQPVVAVSWYAARTYCLWLGALQEVTATSAGLEFRMPLEHEWQWAAGGGNERGYPWGNSEPTEKLANYGRNVDATTAVGSYPEGATPEGLMDMAGNVWEWMANPYREGSSDLCLRGGSWGLNAVELGCSARFSNLPVSWFNGFGFRVVCSQSLKTG